MLKLKTRDIVLLSIALIGASAALFFDDLSLSEKIGLSITVVSVLFIFAVSFFTRLSIPSDIKSAIKGMSFEEAQTYLVNIGLSEKESKLILENGDFE